MVPWNVIFLAITSVQCYTLSGLTEVPKRRIAIMINNVSFFYVGVASFSVNIVHIS